MGDKSPKAIRKKSEQRQSKAVQTKQRKQQHTNQELLFAGKKAKR